MIPLDGCGLEMAGKREGKEREEAFPVTLSLDFSKPNKVDHSAETKV